MNGLCFLFSGCMSFTGGIDYAAAILSTFFECERACDPEACISEAMPASGLVIECEALLALV